MTLLLTKTEHTKEAQGTRREVAGIMRGKQVFFFKLLPGAENEINITNPVDLITAGNIVEPLLQFPAKRAGSGLK